MKKPWWEEKAEQVRVERMLEGIGEKKAERNKVTQAVTKPNPLTPVEALRINIRKLKNELSAVREENVNLRADMVAKNSKLAEQHQKLRQAEHEANGLRTLVDLYGLCNPDIQVARLSLEEAIDRRWMELTRQNKERSGIPIKTVGGEEYVEWEEKRMLEQLLIINKKPDQDEEVERLKNNLINKIREAATTNQQNQQNQGEANETE